MRVRIPGELPFLVGGAVVALACVGFSQEDREFEDLPVNHYAMVGHLPGCACCWRYDLARRPLTAEDAERIERQTQERIRVLQASGRVDLHPANR